MDNLFEISNKTAGVLYLKNNYTHNFKLKKKIYGQINAVLIIYQATQNITELFFLNCENTSNSNGNVIIRPLISNGKIKVTYSADSFSITPPNEFAVFLTALTPKISYETIDILELFAKN